MNKKQRRRLDISTCVSLRWLFSKTLESHKLQEIQLCINWDRSKPNKSTSPSVVKVKHEKQQEITPQKLKWMDWMDAQQSPLVTNRFQMSLLFPNHHVWQLRWLWGPSGIKFPYPSTMEGEVIFQATNCEKYTMPSTDQQLCSGSTRSKNGNGTILMKIMIWYSTQFNRISISWPGYSSNGRGHPTGKANIFGICKSLENAQSLKAFSGHKNQSNHISELGPFFNRWTSNRTMQV